jgi:hypothetical protein
MKIFLRCKIDTYACFSNGTYFKVLWILYKIWDYLTLSYFRFKSTNDPKAEELTSLDEYISRMKDDQDTILYLAGDTKDSILKSPIL